jgi:hypothetical protein
MQNNPIIRYGKWVLYLADIGIIVFLAGRLQSSVDIVLPNGDIEIWGELTQNYLWGLFLVIFSFVVFTATCLFRFSTEPLPGLPQGVPMRESTKIAGYFLFLLSLCIIIMEIVATYLAFEDEFIGIQAVLGTSVAELIMVVVFALVITGMHVALAFATAKVLHIEFFDQTNGMNTYEPPSATPRVDLTKSGGE